MPQGIESLMPGQAQQAPMPGMMPKPSAATPASVVAQLNAQLSSNPEQRLQQLLQMYAQKPTLALLSQVSEATNAVELEKKKQQQDYMAAFAQQGPQTVADMVKQRAQQVAQQPVMAARGGIMQGYAGGGAVAFEHGGRVQKFQYGPGPQGVMSNPAVLSSIDGVPIYRPSEGPEAGETKEQYRARKEREAAEADEVANRPLRRLYRFLEGKIREPSAVAQMRNAAVAPAAAAAATAPTTGTYQGKSGIADLDIGPSMAPFKGAGTGSDTAVAARDLSIGQAAPAPAQAVGAPITGLPALSPERTAQIQKDQEEAARLAKSREAFIKGTATQSPEVLASRERLQKILSGAYDPQRKALEEAKAERAQGLRSNAEALGLMAARASKAKYVGQALGEAAGAGAEFMGEQRKRIQSLQDKYNELSSQLTVTMAQAQHADIVGDDKLKRDALAKAEEIKAELFNTQRTMRKEAVAEQVQNAQGIAALQKAQADLASARAQMISAGKPTDAQSRESLYRRDPKAFEAMYGAKESAAVANLVRAVNTDPALKSYADALKLGMPNAEASYNARYKELVAMYAPELLLGAGGGGGGDSSARAAADKILSGK